MAKHLEKEGIILDDQDEKDIFWIVIFGFVDLIKSIFGGKKND